MTNGEKIKEIFPYLTKQMLADNINIFEWWSAEYKEPTTKNDISNKSIIYKAKESKEIQEDLDRLRKLNEQTTKNDIAQERYQDLIEYFGDEKVAKTILESKKEFKAWLERLRWNVKRADELARELEQIKSTTKNNLGVDCISRAQTQTEIEMNAFRYTLAKEHGGMGEVEWNSHLISIDDAVDIIRNMPSVTPQEPRWIPTKERLPEEDGEYYATVYDTDENYKYRDIAEFEDGIWQYKDYVKVLAWMPLPKLFEPQESEE